ncbi:MAG: DUF1223 domain-containing protein [Alphaproteobacteria bacterium]|nr:DUF1223 domain-containing protein [Alphaproteobacteria bacterium]MBU1514858.1 DUF1223 domain-containing protein [Alphaproteobacteria bacterium]MBU2093779.1 DUF1223 domain-containing protein [Alphaproteobacteria bacterium]MBU2149400.1 DUF1223 domain-containing protein [Alphaproteobacteria bacterium]MBU2305360.1 DUF1223 domain-containing protein [Alphaproteobacteria bacterium]
MRKAALLSLFLLAWPVGAAAKPPVLVELFTAQGCGSCNDANGYLAKLADRPGVLALTFSVDYWDYLGWTDTFAKPEYAERQKAYVTRLKLREPYTPQVVVDGHDEAQGLKTAEVDRLVRAAAAAPRNAPDIRFVGARRVDVGSARVAKGGGEVWLIRYDPRAVEVTVKAGDNRGETVVQKNVVREIRRLGSWRGKPQAYRLPAEADDGLKTVVVVQAPRGGRVLGLAQRKS